jgi:hypothetical protein
VFALGHKAILPFLIDLLDEALLELPNGATRDIRFSRMQKQESALTKKPEILRVCERNCVRAIND